MTHLCFVLSLVCLYVCVCECLLHNNVRMYMSTQYPYVRGPLRECRSIRSGASGLPFYCAPLVCISVVIELLAVWRHNKPKTKKYTIRHGGIWALDLSSSRKIGDSPIKLEMKLGPQTHFQYSVPVWRDHEIGPKAVNNGDKYSTAQKRNMTRSARGNLVQWVNL